MTIGRCKRSISKNKLGRSIKMTGCFLTVSRVVGMKETVVRVVGVRVGSGSSYVS